MKLEPFDQYQLLVTEVKKYTDNPDLYLLAKLQEETGELAKEVVKKVDNCEDKIDLTLELGDILWVITAIAEDNGIKLSEIVRENLEKLKSRNLLK